VSSSLRADGSEIPVELSIIATKRRNGVLVTGFARDPAARPRDASLALTQPRQAQFGVVVSEIATREIRSVTTRTLACSVTSRPSCRHLGYRLISWTSMRL